MFSETFMLFCFPRSQNIDDFVTERRNQLEKFYIYLPLQNGISSSSGKSNFV